MQTNNNNKNTQPNSSISMGNKGSKKSYDVSPTGAGGASGAGGSSTATPTDPNAPSQVRGTGAYLAKICKVTDMKNDECKAFDIEHTRFLLVKNEKGFHAIGNKCTHYAAPLSKGVYCNGHIRCPWHGATFNVETGDIEDFPGLDSLPKYEIMVDGDDVKLVCPPMNYNNGKRTRPMCTAEDTTDTNHVLIIGGGAAATSCAETLRQEGHKGAITMLSDEAYLPYDRPKLSKQMDVVVDKILLRTAEFYKEHCIDVKLNSAVTSVDTKQQIVHTAKGQHKYGKLVLATGGGARKLTCPGADLKGVHYIRTPDDTKDVAKGAANAKNIVIIGSSFIGMEGAAVLSQKEGHTVTAIDMLDTPFGMVLGPQVGNALKKLHEKNGVKFHMKSALKELRGDAKGNVTEVVLDGDVVLPADLVIAGIGCTPNTSYLSGSGIDMDQRGFVPVNHQLQTNVPNVYAAGDIVTFPLDCFDLPSANIQHWQMALKHGQVVGRNLHCPEKMSVCSVPFFWSVMFGKSLRYTGYGPGYDDVHVNGNTDELKFVAYYFKDGIVRAVATLGCDPVAAVWAELFLAKKKITKDQVEKNTANDWNSLLHS